MDKTQEELKDASANPHNWGYDLVCSLINAKSRDRTSDQADLQTLFDYANDTETCYLEFKANPFKPGEKYSKDYPEGYRPGETADDYAWNVVKAIIALANTAGGAVVLGVEDKGHQPIQKICEECWSDDRWDESTRKILALIKNFYVLSDHTANGSPNEKRYQSKTINLFEDTYEWLKDPTHIDIKHCHYQGYALPVILVPAVNAKEGNGLLFVKERETGREILLVRKGGDVGQTLSLTSSRSIRYYKQPKEPSLARPTDIISPQTKRHWSNCPHITGFIGRTADLNRLYESFTNPRDARIQWIHGGLGIGKSAFVRKFINICCNDNTKSIFDAAFFLDAQGQTFAQAICKLRTHASSFKDFCEINLDENPVGKLFKSPQSAGPQLFKHSARKLIERLNTYQGPGKILIVLDNVDNPNLLNEPPLDSILDDALKGCIRFCITSRIKPSNNSRISNFPLMPLSEDDALGILSQRKPTDSEHEIAQKIVKLVNCNALALDLIAAQVENDSAPEPYARTFVELNSGDIAPTLHADLTTLYGKSIERLKKAAAHGDNAIFLFALSAWFPQDNIPEDLLKKAFYRYLGRTRPLPTLHDNDDKWSRHIEALTREGLIQQCPNSNGYKAQLFGQDILWTQPETYEVWQDVFEAIKAEAAPVNASNGNFFTKWYDFLINFIDLTVSPHTSDNPEIQKAQKAATEAVAKWIASDKELRKLLQTVVENFGYLERVKRICNKLVPVYKYSSWHRMRGAGHHYLFFLSLQKIIAAKWNQNIKAFKGICGKIRLEFARLPEGDASENDEIAYAKNLMSDVRQNAKLDNYEIIKDDMDKSLQIILKYKDRHLGLLVRSYLEKAKIELEFRKYRKVKKSLKSLMRIIRKVGNVFPREDILRCCKEQLAYLHICRKPSSKKARIRYRNLIAELKSSKSAIPSVETSEFQRELRILLLFKSYYFSSIIHQQRGEIDDAKFALEGASKLCDDIFNPGGNDNKKESFPSRFENYRVRAGILRLQAKLDDISGKSKNAQKEIDSAKDYDLDAYHLFYETYNTHQPNLDFADLVDDYGNTYVLADGHGDIAINNLKKAIQHVEEALRIRKELLPSNHVKIFNSYNRLAYLRGISAMIHSELAHRDIEKLIGDQDRAENSERLRASSEPLLKKLAEIVKFKNQSIEAFRNQLIENEQREEGERIREILFQRQDKLLESWLDNTHIPQQ